MKTKDKPQAKQYVIYSRKSKFTGKGESIENQIELCRQYIAMHFGEDAAENVLVTLPRSSRRSVSCPPIKKLLPSCWRRPRRSSAAARTATTQSLRCSGKSIPKRKIVSSGWWNPCPLPATPLRSTSCSKSTRSIRRARPSRCALPNWKPSPSRAGCSIRSSPSIRK